MKIKTRIAEAYDRLSIYGSCDYYVLMHKDTITAISILVHGGTDTREAFVECLGAALEAVYQRNGRLAVALEGLLKVPGDHMTACEKTMGESHPCTCGADFARTILQ